MSKYTIFLVLALGLLCSYGLWEAQHPVTRNIIVKDPNFIAWQGIKICQLSDLHIEHPGRLEEWIQQRLAQEQPDLIVLTGDMSQWRANPLPSIEFTEKLKAPLGTYGVLGDADVSTNRQHCQFCHPNFDIHRLRQNPRFLQNETVRLPLGNGKELTVLGIDSTRHKNLQSVLNNLPGNPLIILSHSPAACADLRPPMPALCLAGDTHGAQFRFLQPLYALYDPENDPYVAGQYSLSPSYRLFVSSGLGTNPKMPLRIGVPPEISFFSFQPEHEAAE